MSQEEIVAKVKAVMAEVLERKPAELDDFLTLAALAIDSLDLMEMAEELQAQFHIVIEDEEFERILTIGDFCELVAFKVHR